MLDMLELSKGLVAYNVLYLATVWAFALGAIAVYWAFPHWYTFVLAFLVVSSRHQALLNVEHEAIHGKLLPGRRLEQLRWPLFLRGAGRLALRRIAGPSPEPPPSARNSQGSGPRSARGRQQAKSRRAL